MIERGKGGWRWWIEEEKEWEIGKENFTHAAEEESKIRKWNNE